MIAERVERGGRNGVDRIGADQFFHVNDVACRILGAVLAQVGAEPRTFGDLPPRCRTVLVFDR
jgi:hypothetical protein